MSREILKGATPMGDRPRANLHLTEEQFQCLQYSQHPVFPELETARLDKKRINSLPQTQIILTQTEHLMPDIEQIPQTDYTSYRLFLRTGDRDQYQEPYFRKRAKLSAAALRLFLGHSEFKDLVQDYLWNICEESNWVLPAHEPTPIDLFAAETGLLLAETLLLLGDTLDGEVRHRVRTEVTKRIFEPYLRFFRLHHWYQQSHNWNGVCNGSIAATFVLLEPEPLVVRQALELALAGLEVFLETAFEEDGSSTEGVSYWHYGLINVVVLAEYLRARSNGKIDLLAVEKLRRIAAYPAKMQLSGPHFASFSDCNETASFHPGIIARLRERTGETSLRNLLAQPAKIEDDWRLPMQIRNILWWDGLQSDAAQITDSWLPAGGTARLVALRSQRDIPVVLCAKAGHNGENHNHNDIGSFLLHVQGENLLTDPGRGLYSRDYFGPHRYDNIFANSYGHGVPRIDGRLQSTGKTFSGTLQFDERASEQNDYKQIAIEFAGAYPCEQLTGARRELRLATRGEEAGTVRLHDQFQFSEGLHEVEETFITWLDCEIDGATAHIRGQQHDLSLTIEQPQGLRFQLEHLEEQSRANQKTAVLKRLSFLIPEVRTVDVKVKMIVIRH
jgi:hypothetical protein